MRFRELSIGQQFTLANASEVFVRIGERIYRDALGQAWRIRNANDKVQLVTSGVSRNPALPTRNGV